MNGIRFGLAAIKNLGENAGNNIIRTREKVGFINNLHHFLLSVDLHSVNRKVIESLIYAGSFDFTGANRATLLATVNGAIALAQSVNEELIKGQNSLFATDINNDNSINYPLLKYNHVNPW